MLQLDGSTGSGSPPGLAFKLDSSTPRVPIYCEYYECVSAFAKRAFSLAKDLDSFPAWSQAASSYVDLYLRLATMYHRRTMHHRRPPHQLETCASPPSLSSIPVTDESM